MILLTGFEPFGGDATNPSIEAAREAAAELSASGVAAVAEELPCVFADAPRALRRAIRSHRPDVVLCVGFAATRSVVSLERVAINLIDARIPDNTGDRPVDEAVVAGAPAAFFTALPIKRTLAALTGAGIAAEVSQTAGTYVCNQVFYSLMHQLAESETRIPAGFVHVPPPGHRGGALPPAGELARALSMIAREALNPAPDDLVAAGTES